MAAAAGALGIKLEKVGYYSLNDEGRSPETSDIRRALVLIGSAMGVSVIMGFAFLAALA
jgi:adenosylcobinamide-phosphate synthase